MKWIRARTNLTAAYKLASVVLWLISILWFVREPGFEPFLLAGGTLLGFLGNLGSVNGKDTTSADHDNKLSSETAADGSPSASSRLSSPSQASIIPALLRGDISGQRLVRLLGLYGKHGGAKFSSADLDRSWIPGQLGQRTYTFLSKTLIAFCVSTPSAFTMAAVSEDLAVGAVLPLTAAISMGYGLVRALVGRDDEVDLSGDRDSESLDMAETYGLIVLVMTFSFVMRILPVVLERNPPTPVADEATEALRGSIRLGMLLIGGKWTYTSAEFVSNIRRKATARSNAAHGLAASFVAMAGGSITATTALLYTGGDLGERDQGSIILAVAVLVGLTIRNHGLRDSCRHGILRLVFRVFYKYPLSHAKYLAAVATPDGPLTEGTDGRFAFSRALERKDFIASSRAAE